MEKFKENCGIFWKKFKKFCKNLWLRITLLWLLFLKNIKAFIISFIAVCLILIGFGVITATSPGLGWICDKLGLIELANNITGNTDETTSFESVVSVVLSAVVTIGIYANKAQTLVSTDIKSKKLKIALYKAGITIKSSGNLAKSIETLAGTDLDGDGKVADIDSTTYEESKPTVITSIKNMFSDAKIILTAKIEDEDDAEAIKETANLNDIEDSLDAVTTEVATIAKDSIDTKIDVISEVVEDKITDETTTETTSIVSSLKTKIAAIFTSVKTWIHTIIDKIFMKNTVVDSEETIVSDAETVEATTTSTDTVAASKTIVLAVEDTTTTETNTEVATVKPVVATVKTSKSNINDFINSLK